MTTEIDQLKRALQDCIDQMTSLEEFNLSRDLDPDEAEACWHDAIAHAKQLLKTLGTPEEIPFSQPEDAMTETKLVDQPTQRGFSYYKFTDGNGVSCSLQKSSAASREMLWLGCNEIGLKKFTPGKGWQDIELKRNGIPLKAGDLRQWQSFTINFETGEVELGD